MNTTADDNGNGRVTMAVISTKLDAVISRLDQMNDLPARVAVIEKEQCISAEEIDKLRGEHDRLKTEQRAWGAVNTLAAVVAGILGVRS